MIKKRAVVFTKNWSPYNRGELAAFQQDKAQALVDRGIAQFAPDKKETEAVKAPPDVSNRRMDTQEDSPRKKTRNRIVDTE